MQPKIIPPNTAFLKATLLPALAANKPPVKKPETMGLMKSSLFLKWIKRHSLELNRPAQRANDPPKTGARFFINITLIKMITHRRVAPFWESTTYL